MSATNSLEQVLLGGGLIGFLVLPVGLLSYILKGGGEKQPVLLFGGLAVFGICMFIHRIGYPYRYKRQ